MKRTNPALGLPSGKDVSTFRCHAFASFCQPLFFTGPCTVMWFRR